MNTVTHIYQRANEAAATVDPMILASALDHIAKTAAKSSSQSRRIRWIERRAVIALEGREYRDIDVDLPRDPGNSPERLRVQVMRLKVDNAYLLEVLRAVLDDDDHDEAKRKARAAIAKFSGASA